MDKSLSVKLTVISFFLLCMVVMAHSFNVEPGGSTTQQWVWYIETFLSTKFIKFVIPVFAFISGYLFFYDWNKEQTFEGDVFKRKIIKRFRTLGIPYVFWCTFWFVFLYVVQMLPGMGKFFSLPLHQMPLRDQIHNWIIDPLNYPFWYLRELLLLSLISPLLFLWVKYLKIFGLVAIYILAVFFRSWFEIGQTEFFRWHMIFCFCVGIYLAINKINTRTKLTLPVQMLVVIVPLFLCAYLEYIEIFDPVFKKSEPMRLLSIVTNAILSFALWSLYDFIDDRRPFKVSKWFGYSFLIYALHGVLIQMLTKAYVAFLKPGPIVCLILYFAVALAMIWGCLYFGYYLKKFAPRVYDFVTGSR